MTDKRADEGGYILVVLAAVLVILLGFAALAVDVGIMYSAHTAAQRAADAAALGGAATFMESPYAIDPVGLATTRATDTAVQNTILGTPIQSSEVAVSIDYPDRLVTVNLNHTIPTFFAGVLGQKLANVAVVAHAEAKPSGRYPCVKPWFIPNSILADRTLGACGACAATPQQLLAKYDTNTQESTVTDWALAYILAQTSPTSPSFTIKPGNPSGALGPGDFFGIQLHNDPLLNEPPGSPGASIYRYDIGHCDPSNSTLMCGDVYPVKTGNMTGPTNQGTDDLVTLLGTSTPDTWNGFVGGRASFMRHPSNQVVFSSHQVIPAPIWDVCSTLDCNCPGSGCNKLNGPMMVRVIGFAKVFIDGVGSGGVQAHLIDVKACGPPGGANNDPGFPIRLVRIK